MQEPGVISQYVKSLAAELHLDPLLSRRLQQEVEDHLQEAVAADPTADRREAERRAVANFGDARVIAAQFTVVSLAKQAKRAGIAAVTIIAAIFLVMKARLTWYVVMQSPTPDQWGTVRGIVGSIDRYAFWLSVFLGIAAWMYIGSRAIPAAVTVEYRAQLRRFLFLCSAATGALVASVVCDGILASLRVVATPWSSASLVPAFSMAIEVACAAVLVLYVSGMARRTASLG